LTVSEVALSMMALLRLESLLFGKFTGRSSVTGQWTFPFPQVPVE
jgi:hypothetical protein